MRLAALSLAGHPDPERFAAEFSGTERTVAEYLLAEVLDRQREEVRRLLLRTSVLERVNGELADLLTGGSGGERVLQDLEEANAFVVSLDAARSWFRYHHLFADLLQLELRRTEPDEVAALHELAAGWLAGHGFPVEAIRHAQAARDWGLAARLLADHWPGLYLGGQAATVHALLAGFPAEARAADAELAAVAAADELAQGSLEAAERYLELAERGSASVPEGRRGQAQVLLGVVRLLLAGQRGNLPAVAEEAQRLQAAAEAPEARRAAAGPGRGAARAGADQPRRRRDLGRPARPGRAAPGAGGRAGAPDRAAVSRVHGPGVPGGERAHPVVPAGRGAQQAGDRAGRAARLDRRAVRRLRLHDAWIRAGLAGAAGRGRDLGAARRAHHQSGSRPRGGDGGPLRPRPARAGARPGRRRAGRVPGRRAAGRTPHPLAGHVRGLAGASPWCASARPSAPSRSSPASATATATAGEMRIAAAALRLAQDDPHAATAALAPVLDGSAPVGWRSWLVEAFLLEAIARDALGDPAAAGRALERALDLAEPDGALLWFLLHPAPGLLERHARQRTAHAALIAEILDLLAGNRPAPPSAGPRPPLEPLSNSEIRVLRYLPTHLSAPEIASELSVSTSTVKTHLRNLYAKLGAHSRAEAVESARALGLLAPSARQR